MGIHFFFKLLLLQIILRTSARAVLRILTIYGLSSNEEKKISNFQQEFLKKK